MKRRIHVRVGYVVQTPWLAKTSSRGVGMMSSQFISGSFVNFPKFTFTRFLHAINKSVETNWRYFPHGQTACK